MSASRQMRRVSLIGDGEIEKSIKTDERRVKTLLSRLICFLDMFVGLNDSLSLFLSLSPCLCLSVCLSLSLSEPVWPSSKALAW